MNKIGIASVLACLLLVIACVSEPGTGFWGNFFDGMNKGTVQKPKKDPYRVEVKRTKRVTEPSAFLHPPYGDGSCKKCHSQNLTGLRPAETRKLCISCHENFYTPFEYVHGPVAAGACLECHHHHWSRIPGVLKKAAGDLCLSCHEERSILRGSCEWRTDPTKTCVACHDPHGGGDRYFLVRSHEGGR